MNTSLDASKTEAIDPKAAFRWSNPIHVAAFGFGSGLSPVMPGTCGTVVAVPLVVLMGLLPNWAYLLITLLAFVVGIYICGKTAVDLGVHDYGGIVWDEIVGYAVTLFFVPIHWLTLLLGFLLFRLFDIWKPWPIGWCDRKVSGGLGIMLDDVIAGLMAAVCLVCISSLY